MADDQNEIRISITLDDGSVREGFARIKQAGEDTGAGLNGAFSGIGKTLIGLAAAYLTFSEGKKFIEDSIAAAEKYDTALNNMQKSLAAAGSYSAAASQSFTELADQIERTTTTSATQALGLEALARNYATSNEQAKQLTKAAIDLAAATGKDASTALQQLGGTLDGTAGRLGKIVPQVRSLTEYQLRMGDAIAIVAARFKDSAAGDVQTYQGALTQLSNSFEKVLISIGQMVTQSPAIRAVIQFLGQEFLKLSDYLKSVSFEGFFNGAITGAILFGRAINELIIMPVELIYDVVRTTFDGIRELFQVFVFGVASLADKISSFFSPDSQVSMSIKAFAESSKSVLLDFAHQTDEGLKKIGDTKLSDTIGADLASLQEKVSNSHPFSSLRQDMDDTKNDGLRLSGELINVGSAFDKMRMGATSSLALLAADSNKYCEQIGASVAKTFIGGVAGAMAAMGKALVQGKDIFKAFAGALLSALGQAAIQMGAAYILMGVARAFSSYGMDPTATGLIATGTAMSVLGGALMALGEGASGSAPSTSAASGGGGGSTSIGGQPQQSPTPAVQGPQKTVTVNIHGSVFDTKETGLRIVELVNDAFNTQGAQVLVK